MIVSRISLFSLIAIFTSSHALSSTATTNSFPTVGLKSTGQSQLAILDGGEWSTIQALLQNEGRLSKRVSTKYGYMTIVTGRDEDNQRIIAMQTDEKNTVYKDSVAVIPDRVSETDAISTYISSLSAIHCALPKLRDIGGDSDSAMISGKAVILGSNELACFAAEGLASLGVKVSLVSPGSPKVKKNVGNLEVIKPAVGSDEIGFSEHVGEFDSLVDTISNEMKSTRIFDDEDESYFGGSSTMDLLVSRHKCQRYISTLSESQKIVGKEGIFGGPGKADNYAKQCGQASFLKNPECRPIPPPTDIGSSMEALLGKGVILTQQQRKKLYAKSDIVRGWSLADFWENTRWPRDSSGTSDLRFGLPVFGDDEDDDEPMLSAPPPRSFERIAVRKLLQKDSLDDTHDDEADEAPTPVQNNPHVYQIAGVSGLKTEIIEQDKDCILFLSAKFCKTCKSLDPKYTRMARIEKENDSPILYAKTEVGSRWGKQLGAYLEVDAVPAFVLFRKGKRFGPPLSSSTLPSKKIDRALKLLEAGDDWDPSILKEEK